MSLNFYFFETRNESKLCLHVFICFVNKTNVRRIKLESNIETQERVVKR